MEAEMRNEQNCGFFICVNIALKNEESSFFSCNLIPYLVSLAHE